MSTDRISNLLSSLKNASMAGKPFLETAYFKQGEKVLEVLKDKGLLQSVKIYKDENTKFKGLHADLVDVSGKIRKMEIRRISKPGRRTYQEYKKLLKVKAGLGVLVVSTSRGVMGGEEARKKKLGGELICKVFFE
jgi:small subunit ribosomal protein S8